MIGVLRGQQVSLVQLERPTILVGDMAGQSTWVKKGPGVSSVLSARREREISAVEFTVLRYSLDHDLSQYSWLHDPFSAALKLVLSSAPVGMQPPLDTLPQAERTYAERLYELERHLRVTHLLLPEIRRVHGVDASDDQKWSAVEDYFLNLADQSALFFAGQKDVDTHLAALEISLRQRAVVPKIIEARGSYTATAASLSQVFVLKNPHWTTKRCDVARTTLGEEDYRTSVLWIELVTARPKRLSAIKAKRSELLTRLRQQAGEYVLRFEQFAALSFEEKGQIYRDLRAGVLAVGVAGLEGVAAGLPQAVFLGASFALLNPLLDYYCSVDEQPGRAATFQMFFGSRPLTDYLPPDR